ncbi:MAG: hypothetical protein WCA28_26020, partial [Bradyrhizobium sp.]
MPRHCEERLVRRSSTSEGGSDEAIHAAELNCEMDCFASIAMTMWLFRRNQFLDLAQLLLAEEHFLA